MRHYWNAYDSVFPSEDEHAIEEAAANSATRARAGPVGACGWGFLRRARFSARRSHCMRRSRALADSAARYGLDARIAAHPYLNMPATADGKIPQLLSQTGAFKDTRNLVPSDALIPYDVGVAFWSDGAQKPRYIAVPKGKIKFSPTGEWTFPAGTVFVKTFELPTDAQDPSVQRRLETRLLMVGPAHSVYGVVYKWRADLSDADLLPDGLNEQIPIRGAGGADARADLALPEPQGMRDLPHRAQRRRPWGKDAADEPRLRLSLRASWTTSCERGVISGCSIRRCAREDIARLRAAGAVYGHFAQPGRSSPLLPRCQLLGLPPSRRHRRQLRRPLRHAAREAGIDRRARAARSRHRSAAHHLAARCVALDRVHAGQYGRRHPYAAARPNDHRPARRRAIAAVDRQLAGSAGARSAADPPGGRHVRRYRCRSPSASPSRAPTSATRSTAVCRADPICITTSRSRFPRPPWCEPGRSNRASPRASRRRKSSRSANSARAGRRPRARSPPAVTMANSPGGWLAGRDDG